MTNENEDIVEGTYEDAEDLGESLRTNAPQITDFDTYFAEEKEAAEKTLQRSDIFAEAEEAVITSADFTLTPAEPPFPLGTRFFAKERQGAGRFFVGSAVKYESMRGLGIVGSNIALLNSPKFNRLVEERRLGLWAHFMAPTVAAESYGGLHLLINCYDRAAFTFGFYQLAAHTPNENLILLFRELLKLPNARIYFPDLLLDSAGRVTAQTPSGTKNLEREVVVTLPSGTQETQIPEFMTYLNPSVRAVEAGEVMNAAKLMHWILNDPAAMNASVRVPFEIMRKKARRFAPTYGLIGKEVELAIWVSDLLHHGRGGRDVKAKILDALAAPSLDSKLDALSRIDRYTSAYPLGKFLERRNTVGTVITELQREGRFNGIRFGEGELSVSDA